MPGETNTDRIRGLELGAATLLVRVDNLRSGLERHEESTSEFIKQIQDLDRRLSVVEHRVGAIDKRLDELIARRWDLWKLILAAFLGSILTVTSGFVGRWLDRLVGPQPHQTAPNTPTPRRP